MLLSSRILVIAIALGISAVSLSACGQRGPLYLPTEPAAANRATLPQTLLPPSLRRVDPPAPQTTPAPASPAASAATAAPQ